MGIYGQFVQSNHFQLQPWTNKTMSRGVLHPYTALSYKMLNNG